MRSAVSVCVTTTLTCHEFVLFPIHGLSRIFTFALETGSSVQNSESYTCFCLLSTGGTCSTKHQSIFQHFLCLQFLPRYQFLPKQIAHPKECLLQRVFNGFGSNLGSVFHWKTGGYFLIFLKQTLIQQEANSLERIFPEMITELCKQNGFAHLTVAHQRRTFRRLNENEREIQNGFLSLLSRRWPAGARKTGQKVAACGAAVEPWEQNNLEYHKLHRATSIQQPKQTEHIHRVT